MRADRRIRSTTGHRPGEGATMARKRGATARPPTVHDEAVHLAHQLSGETDPAFAARWSVDRERRTGFFTDTSICIGCKACEVACKEWNHNPRDGDLQLLGSSYDNTGSLGASTWRHVAFIEQGSERIEQARNPGGRWSGWGCPPCGPRVPLRLPPARRTPLPRTPPSSAG